ncbi:hypothetical protein [Luteolibacter sp. LG18]|uniref:hypothetical protein n=1 Tax=Luteolibacter sp. LG18 TaxID=2819286 RepID=UPI002B30C041|nr:hypothetical protein llg_38120 [Luteolibacter sp. LG18]
MKRYLAFSLLAVAISLGFATRHREVGVRPDPAVEAHRVSAGKELPAPRQPDPKRVSSRTPEPVPPEERDQALAVIEEAVASYEAAAVKRISPYLSSPDRDLRNAAREGLIQLGEPDGIAALRLAATRMSDPADIQACREAADFLELPPWTETPAAREMIAELIAHPEPSPPPP